MFEINYAIVQNEYDDFTGEDGYLQIKINNYQFGEIYPEELYDIMPTVSLRDWMERLIRVCKYLETYDYVALSDVDSYNGWIEFKRMAQNVLISIVRAAKKNGTQDIELSLEDPVVSEWADQAVSYAEFKKELLDKAGEYLKFLIAHNADDGMFKDFRRKYEIFLQNR